MGTEQLLSERELEELANNVWIEDDEGVLAPIQSLLNIETSLPISEPGTSKQASSNISGKSEKSNKTQSNSSSRYLRKRPLSQRELEDLANAFEDGLELLSDEEIDDPNYSSEEPEDSSSSENEDFEQCLLFTQNIQKNKNKQNKENIPKKTKIRHHRRKED